MSELHESPVIDLRPTQFTVGMIEVSDKKMHLLSLAPPDQQAFMQGHPILAVLGPDGKLYALPLAHGKLASGLPGFKAK